MRGDIPIMNPILAGGDIRGPAAFACIVLLAMIAYFRWRTGRGKRGSDRFLICTTALISGPLSGVFYFLVDAYLISRHDFIHPDDYWGDLLALATLGGAAGIAASAILWIGLSGPRTKADG